MGVLLAEYRCCLGVEFSPEPELGLQPGGRGGNAAHVEDRGVYPQRNKRSAVSMAAAGSVQHHRCRERALAVSHPPGVAPRVAQGSQVQPVVVIVVTGPTFLDRRTAPRTRKPQHQQSTRQPRESTAQAPRHPHPSPAPWPTPASNNQPNPQTRCQSPKSRPRSWQRPQAPTGRNPLCHRSKPQMTARNGPMPDCSGAATVR